MNNNGIINPNSSGYNNFDAANSSDVGTCKKDTAKDTIKDNTSAAASQILQTETNKNKALKRKAESNVSDLSANQDPNTAPDIARKAAKVTAVSGGFSKVHKQPLEAESGDENELMSSKAEERKQQIMTFKKGWKEVLKEYHNPDQNIMKELQTHAETIRKKWVEMVTLPWEALDNSQIESLKSESENIEKKWSETSFCLKFASVMESGEGITKSGEGITNSEHDEEFALIKIEIEKFVDELQRNPVCRAIDDSHRFLSGRRSVVHFLDLKREIDSKALGQSLNDALTKDYKELDHMIDKLKRLNAALKEDVIDKLKDPSLEIHATLQEQQEFVQFYKECQDMTKFFEHKPTKLEIGIHDIKLGEAKTLYAENKELSNYLGQDSYIAGEGFLGGYVY